MAAMTEVLKGIVRALGDPGAQWAQQHLEVLAVLNTQSTLSQQQVEETAKLAAETKALKDPWEAGSAAQAAGTRALRDSYEAHRAAVRRRQGRRPSRRRRRRASVRWLQRRRRASEMLRYLEPAEVHHLSLHILGARRRREQTCCRSDRGSDDPR